jgi:hypothetical protein
LLDKRHDLVTQDDEARLRHDPSAHGVDFRARIPKLDQEASHDFLGFSGVNAIKTIFKPRAHLGVQRNAAARGRGLDLGV